MDLEQLIKDPALDKGQQELAKALEIAEREWENIRLSLELCGDIGNFSKEDFMIGVIEEDVIVRQPLKNPTKSVSGYSPTFYPMYFIRNLLVMDDKFSDLNYRSIEALYVFIELATKAVSRIGLDGNLAMGFGCGYANVRTGWIAEKGWAKERKIFFNTFFMGRKIDYNWDFYCDSAKTIFKELFNRFIHWKKNPEIYVKETKSNARVKPLLV